MANKSIPVINKDCSPCISLLRGLLLFSLFVNCNGQPLYSEVTDTGISWQRLRPLANNPELDSGTALDRACIPGETVVVRNPADMDTAQKLGLHKGQFVICINNINHNELEVVDGPGNTWVLQQNQVNATTGFPDNWTAFDRDYLVWAYNRETIIFRESLRNTYEGNFFYLLLDTDRNNNISAGILIDSGTGYADLKPYITPVIDTGKLIVVSTHSHWDHFGGHRHFIGMEDIELLGYKPEEKYNPYPDYDLAGLQSFFGLKDWPDKHAKYSVGRRDLIIIPIPGHTPDSIAIYDYKEKILFTGDTVTPGMIFIENWTDALNSLSRLDEFTRRHKVKWLLGGHVEMSKQHSWNGKYEYFYFGTNTHWDEHSVQMPVSFIAQTLETINEKINNANKHTPEYDARIIDRQFHSIPIVPVPFPGIPDYYRINAERLVEKLRRRHDKHDLTRGKQ